MPSSVAALAFLKSTVVTGAGNPLSTGISDVIPETQLPAVNSSSVYVFALPDK
jgi:alcohol dehydrogenase (cytochrome c)